MDVDFQPCPDERLVNAIICSYGTTKTSSPHAFMRKMRRDDPRLEEGGRSILFREMFTQRASATVLEQRQASTVSVRCMRRSNHEERPSSVLHARVHVSMEGRAAERGKGRRPAMSAMWRPYSRVQASRVSILFNRLPTALQQQRQEERQGTGRPTTLQLRYHLNGVRYDAGLPEGPVSDLQHGPARWPGSVPRRPRSWDRKGARAVVCSLQQWTRKLQGRSEPAEGSGALLGTICDRLIEPWSTAGQLYA